ncbi:MAG: site-2 protease family protein [Patescibacteria group bacterium]
MEITIFSIIVLFLSVVIHELAHGSVALRLGDATAKEAGRLTLNPLKHIDLFGTIILPLILIFSYSTSGFSGPIFGWAKPVPINPFNFKDQKWGALKVSLAGPATNFLIAIIFGLIIRFAQMPDQLSFLFGIIVFYNFLWGIFNLVPLPPLDGSWILFRFLPDKIFANFKIFLSRYGFFILIFFIFYGLKWVSLLAYILFYFTTGRVFAL